MKICYEMSIIFYYQFADGEQGLITLFTKEFMVWPVVKPAVDGVVKNRHGLKAW